MENPLKRLMQLQKEDQNAGICSACSENEYVIRTAILYSKNRERAAMT